MPFPVHGHKTDVSAPVVGQKRGAFLLPLPLVVAEPSEDWMTPTHIGKGVRVTESPVKR